MSTPKTPAVQSAPIPAEINPESQASADEAARKAKERQQKGVTATKTILTGGLDEDTTTKKSNLGA